MVMVMVNLTPKKTDTDDSNGLENVGRQNVGITNRGHTA
jgi:hypothetical protein